MMIGAGLGFVFGIISTIISAFQFDETETSAGQTILVGLVVAIPLAVMIGVVGGWLWDVFIRTAKP